MLMLAVGTLSTSCEPELRVPYVPPALANWSQPYRGVDGMRLHAFTTGYTIAPEALVLRGGSLARQRTLPLLAFVVQHPRQGPILFGTGPAPAGEREVPGGWIDLGPRLEAAAESDLKTQMERAGLDPKAVRWVILSSLRPHNTGLLAGFPKARVVVAKAEREEAQSGLLGRQLDVSVTEWKLIDYVPEKPVGTLPAHVDLFGDGSILLLDVRGATAGTMALLVRLPRRPVLLAGDALAFAEQLRTVNRPVAAADLEAWWDRAWRIKRFRELAPELIVVPGHDLGPLEAAGSSHVVVHPAPTPPAGIPTPTPHPMERIMPRPMGVPGAAARY